jgi:integrase
MNLDLEGGWLTVAGAVKEHGNRPPYYQAVTKDQRVRVKPIPAFLIDVLRNHLELFPFHKEFVFATREGLLIRKRNFYRRWYEALERACLLRMTPHSLRHTCSSLLDAKGVSVKERMDYVGHSTVAMQLHYTHVGGERLKEIARMLDRELRENLGVASFAGDGSPSAALGADKVRSIGVGDRRRRLSKRYFS